jgi:hypothetical protein
VPSNREVTAEEDTEHSPKRQRGIPLPALALRAVFAFLCVLCGESLASIQKLTRPPSFPPPVARQFHRDSSCSGGMAMW